MSVCYRGTSQECKENFVSWCFNTQFVPQEEDVSDGLQPIYFLQAFIFLKLKLFAVRRESYISDTHVMSAACAG